jgi:hypothetical protein
MEIVWGTVAGFAGMLGFFGGIGLLVWLDKRGKAHERELIHKERIKALEEGRTLPDAEEAHAWAAASRAWAAGMTASAIVLGLGGIAVGATALVFQHATPGQQLPMVAIVWGVCGVVSLVVAVVSLSLLFRREPASETGQDPVPGQTRERPTTTAIWGAEKSPNAPPTEATTD